ncbi:MAG: hypothetical protein IJG55_00950, partial [Synergistaceae bacterium]|nr:hypothetical protein [Synergistaceae bacterium]
VEHDRVLYSCDDIRNGGNALDSGLLFFLIVRHEIDFADSFNIICMITLLFMLFRTKNIDTNSRYIQELCKV